MSSRVKSSAAARRPTVNQNGSAQQQRHFRRAAPYTSRELKSEDLKDALDSYEELQQLKFESYKHQPSAKPDASTPSDRRKALYQKFYRQVQEERKPADCVVLSIANQCLDYPKSLRQCLQERGLSVEMLYLQAETDLTRALQDVRADGSLLCILVEQTNIALSSCTIIIFSESLKIHRNMPKDQAMDFVVAEHSRVLANERPQRDPADIAAQASQLLDDFLDREKIDRHCIPCDTRPLLMLLAEGVHLYSEELETIVDYVRSRQDQIQATSTEGERGNLLPPGLGKPPPLLPTPPGPPQPQSTADAGMIEHTLPTRPPLLPSPVSYPKTKPPPLLSLHRPPGLSLGDLSSRGPLSSHIPYGPPGRLRGPLLPSPFHPGTRGPGGIRGAPPSLKSYRPLFHSSPVAPLLRPSGPRH